MNYAEYFKEMRNKIKKAIAVTCFYSIDISSTQINLQGHLSEYNADNWVSLSLFEFNFIDGDTYFIKYSGDVEINLVTKRFNELPEHIKFYLYEQFDSELIGS